MGPVSINEQEVVLSESESEEEGNNGAISEEDEEDEEYMEGLNSEQRAMLKAQMAKEFHLEELRAMVEQQKSNTQTPVRPRASNDTFRKKSILQVANNSLQLNNNNFPHSQQTATTPALVRTLNPMPSRKNLLSASATPVSSSTSEIRKTAHSNKTMIVTRRASVKAQSADLSHDGLLMEKKMNTDITNALEDLIGVQYNTIQYNTIQYNTIQYNNLIVTGGNIKYNTTQCNSYPSVYVCSS
jgi:hypothetical protein